MKKNKNKTGNSTYILLACLIVTWQIISTILAHQKIELIGITATSNIFIYPVTYVLITYFREKYGPTKVLKLLNIIMICLLMSTILIYFASMIPTVEPNILTNLFNLNIRTSLAVLAAFYLSQTINLYIYDYLRYDKSIKFLLSSTIATTLDSLVFVTISCAGIIKFNELFKLFIGEYIFNAFSLLVYSIVFAFLIKGIKDNQEETKTKKKKKKTQK